MTVRRPLELNIGGKALPPEGAIKSIAKEGQAAFRQPMAGALTLVSQLLQRRRGVAADVAYVQAALLERAARRQARQIGRIAGNGGELFGFVV